jgi:5-methylcytosine-specific restriction endonuclease McrA
MPTRYRPDHDGTHRLAYERAKKIIFATQTVCAICGQPVDFSLKYPHPMCATVDHIIPIDRGGHPSDLSNLQLAHFTCNVKKANRIQQQSGKNSPHPVEIISNRMLPLSTDWKAYRA